MAKLVALGLSVAAQGLITTGWAATRGVFPRERRGGIPAPAPAAQRLSYPVDTSREVFEWNWSPSNTAVIRVSLTRGSKGSLMLMTAAPTPLEDAEPTCAPFFFTRANACFYRKSIYELLRAYAQVEW